jgi:DNA-binding GntR family transcriptional regulator
LASPVAKSKLKKPLRSARTALPLWRSTNEPIGSGSVQVFLAPLMDELAQLQRQCALLSRAANDENVRDYLRANRAFHFIIYNAARSPTLVAMIETLWLQIGPYLNLLRGSGNYVASNATHRAIVDALADHDGKAAAKALRADINDAYAILSKMLR